MKHHQYLSKILLVFNVVLSQLLISHVAQADSVYEWGNWQSSPPVQIKDDVAIVPNNNVTNSEQTRIGTNSGELVAIQASEWVGYNLAVNYVYKNDQEVNCDTGCDDGDRLKSAGYVAGDMKLTLNNTGTENSTGRGYKGSVQVTGTFNGQPFTINTNSDVNNGTYFSRPNSVGEFNSGVQEGSPELNTVDYPILNNDNNAAYGAGGFMFAFNTYEGLANPVFIGKLTPLAQIAEQMRLGNTYSYSGYSRLGSDVNIDVNFSKASWSGNWSPSLAFGHHNGFESAGTIKGSSLTSTSVTGLGPVTNGFVTGGKVDANFIGVFNDGANSTSGIIGKTVLNVVNTSGLGAEGKSPTSNSILRPTDITSTVVQGDIFVATINNRRVECRGICK